MYPIILSGGSGTRLWPLSRSLYPKQFLALHTEHTLFQETLLRLKDIANNPAIIVSNKDHRFLVAENLREINYEAECILLEPEQRNTAPAIATAALSVLSVLNDDKDAVLLVLPSDHVISDINVFKAAVKTAEELAKKDYMVTFGVVPTHAHTGYGYIEFGEAIEAIEEGAFSILSFEEKPDLETAERFVRDGRYLWNSGMFCFKAASYLAELERRHPDIIEHAKRSLEHAEKDLDFVRLEKDSFSLCENISIDYAVMEHTKKGATVTLGAGWSDIGSWDSLWQVCRKDKNENVVKGDVIAKDTTNSFIYGEDKLICTLGLDNLIIVDTQDALFVADKNQVQGVKDIIGTLKKENRKEVKHHRTVYRPWGHYDSICFGESDQVKRISVKPGAKLSLQKHFHRSEHWIVVKGTARVIRGEETLTISENESVYLPLGTVHALENIGEIVLEIIEVQTGSYLGEDDILRLEDLYGRA